MSIESDRHQPFSVVYLNLDHNTQRANHMENLLNFINLTHYRFRAVNGQEFFRNKSYSNSFESAKYFKFDIKKQEQVRNQDIGPNSVGLWLSYLFLMHEIIKSETTKPIVCLEDDNDLDVDFKELLLDYLKMVSADWDILLCSYCNAVPFPEGFGLKVRKVNQFSCTNCFVVRNSTTAKLIADKLNLTRIHSPVDLFLSSLANKQELKVYAVPETIAAQRRELFGTEIPTSGKLTIPGLKNSLIYYMQKLEYLKKNNKEQTFNL